MARTIRKSGMKEVPLSEIKDDLSRFLREAERQEIVITRHGKPAGVLIGFESEEDWFEYRLERDPRFLRRIEEARKSLEAELGRPPSADEMATKLGVSLEEYEQMVGEATAVSLVSLNKKWYETDSYKDVREIDILEDKKAEDPTHRLQNRDLMRLVTRGLNRNERLIIILYYYEDMTMKEIGATLDLSESRVSQMHSSIIQRLQAQLAARRPEFGT